METKVYNNQSDKEKRKPGVKQWIYGILASLCTVAFVIWTGYWPVLILIPVFIDIYITKFVKWGKWKEAKNPHVRKILDWVDAILFALVGVYIITTFFFQNYQIPTSSLEKSLLVGDFLCVSKMSFGARSPMTPFSFPLVQNTLPIFNTKSYIESIQLDYQRFAGTGHVKRDDIVVFNYPSGDTVALKMQDRDYYALCLENGRDQVLANKAIFGETIYRPVDRRENYVKRCLGLPGETIEFKTDSVFIDNQYLKQPTNVQFLYYVQTDGTEISESVINELGMSVEDRIYQIEDLRGFTDKDICDKLGLQLKNGNAGLLYKNMFLTQEMIQKLKTKPFVESIVTRNEYFKRMALLDSNNKLTQPYVYPLNYYRDSIMYGDYPATWIPKKGATIKFDTDIDKKVSTYKRCIENYERNKLDYKDGKVYINGQQADSYTFKMDYYFMIGDNRDNSVDSRYWGFVPEDHLVGKPMFIWLSLNKDKGWFSGKIRWNRIFTNANVQ